MIEVVLGALGDFSGDAVVRSVSADLQADTPFSRDVELLAGPELTEKLQTMGEFPVGAALITPAGGVGSPFLIHVVLRSTEEPASVEGVKAALANALRRAEEWGLASVAIPPLGTGAGNLDIESVAGVMVPALLDHMGSAEHPRSVTIAVSTAFEQEVFSRRIQSEAGPRASGVH
jgi:O-acetyl-ADP-ribose deacetylase (regulator of RNase III)